MSKKFTLFTWGTLALNVLVIIWGAFVRISGSGAGCGRHWPLCKGVLLPSDPQIETIIELAHRASSGLALIFVFGLFLAARRTFRPGGSVRRSAFFALLFVIVEALVGAALVLFELVAEDTSNLRALLGGIHLINTFLLIAALTATGWFSQQPGERYSLRRGPLLSATTIAALLLLLVGGAGAIASLAGTLFPVESLSEGIALDFAADSHFLLRLRIWHPILAIFTASYLLALGGYVIYTSESAKVRIYARILIGTVLFQVGLGMLNLVNLAPLGLQLLHLATADALWCVFVLFTLNSSLISDQRSVTESRVSDEMEGRAIRAQL